MCLLCLFLVCVESLTMWWALKFFKSRIITEQTGMSLQSKFIVTETDKTQAVSDLCNSSICKNFQNDSDIDWIDGSIQIA